MSSDAVIQAKSIIKKVKRDWGAGWSRISTEQQHDAICAEIVRQLLSAQAHCRSENLELEALAERYRSAVALAGL